jgi:hypothetical protein
MIRRLRWGILQEWWCTPVSATEDEVAQAILDEFEAPGITLELVKDRCFGGFTCENPLNRHICFNAGAYTYTGSGQRPVEPAERAEMWRRYMDLSQGDNGFIGDGPFTSDAPQVAEEAKQ